MMTMEVLKSMSDYELRIAVAKEMGYTDIAIREIPIPWLMDLIEEELSGYFGKHLLAIPLYSASDVSAMELFRLLPFPRYIEENKNRDVVCSFGRQLHVVDVFGDSCYNSFARAISCAYLLSRQVKE